MPDRCEFIIGKKWQRVSWTRTFGPGITDVYAMVKREYQILGGDVWIDDVQLEQGDLPTDFAVDVWTKERPINKCRSETRQEFRPCCNSESLGDFR